MVLLWFLYLLSFIVVVLFATLKSGITVTLSVFPYKACGVEEVLSSTYRTW